LICISYQQGPKLRHCKANAFAVGETAVARSRSETRATDLIISLRLKATEETNLDNTYASAQVYENQPWNSDYLIMRGSNLFIFFSLLRQILEAEYASFRYVVLHRYHSAMTRKQETLSAAVVEKSWWHPFDNLISRPDR